jgi:putative acetyltransferase
MLVRPARATDFDAVREVHQRAVRALGADAYSDRQVGAWADWSDVDGLDGVDDDDAHLVLAERRDDPAGFGHLGAADGEVNAVYVHPDHAREGVGAALLAHLEGYARGAGLSELTLSASLNAVDFYARAGYERVGRDVHETTGGVELECIRMRKRL